jgi:predicted nucleic acid-binding protein
VIVTVDINVLLDVFQTRQPFYAESSRIVSLIAAGELVGILPAHGITTLYYLVRKYGTKVDAESAMDRVLAHFQIGNLDATGWTRARQLPMDDFEDAVVAATAEASQSAYIITRNTDDFGNSPVAALTPADFLSRFPLS